MTAITTLHRHGAQWVYTYVGDREEALQAALTREVDRLATRLEEITQAQMTPTRRIRATLETLVPKRQHRALLWVLALSPKGRLAPALAKALAPTMGRYAPRLSVGILAILASEAGQTTPREELLSVLTDMTTAVALFREAAKRQGSDPD